MNQYKSSAVTWQDIDDGVQLAKRYYLPVSKVIGLMFFIIAVLCIVLSEFIDTVWILLIIWWLKPVYDRAILTVLSLFVSRKFTTVKASFSQIAQNIFNFSMIKDLTIRRVSITRSFKLPVFQLEKNEGEAASQRFRVLGQDTTASRAANLTFIAMMTENVIVITIISMLIYIIPDELRDSIFSSQWQADEEFLQYISFVLYLITLSVTEPLYVASGFNLYLRRRMRLEAWDIEQVFRKMVSRNEAD